MSVLQTSGLNLLPYLPRPDEANYKGRNRRQVRNHLGNRRICGRIGILNLDAYKSHSLVFLKDNTFSEIITR